MNGNHSSRVETLRRAKTRQPWTVKLITECATDPSSFKRASEACSTCPRPCESDEVCATAVAKRRELFAKMGRDQVFHLIEGGIDRLVFRNEATVRVADDTRPNTFVSLVGNESKESTE